MNNKWKRTGKAIHRTRNVLVYTVVVFAVGIFMSLTKIGWGEPTLTVGTMIALPALGLFDIVRAFIMDHIDYN